MPSLLDQRPVRRNPVVFGQALVAQQRAQQEALNRAQRAGEFAVREGRMAEAQAERVAQNEKVIGLRERATALAERMERAKLVAVETQLQRKEQQVSAFTKAMKAIGSIAADDAEAELKIADVLANNAAALDEDNTELSGMLKERVTSLQKNILDHRSVALKRDEKMQERALAAEQANAAVALGMAPESINTSTGGITFKKPDAGREKFPSYEAARAKYKDAAIGGVTLPSGEFVLERIGSAEPKATGPSAFMNPAAPAPAGTPPPVVPPKPSTPFAPVEGKTYGREGDMIRFNPDPSLTAQSIQDAYADKLIDEASARKQIEGLGFKPRAK